LFSWWTVYVLNTLSNDAGCSWLMKPWSNYVRADLWIYFTPVGGRSTAISWSVCPLVCLYVSLSTRISQKPHVRISPSFLYMLLMAVVRSFLNGNAIRYLLLVLYMMSCFNIMEEQTGIKGIFDVYISSSPTGGGTGSEVCLPSCILFDFVIGIWDKMCPSLLRCCCCLRAVNMYTFADSNACTNDVLLETLFLYVWGA